MRRIFFWTHFAMGLATGLFILVMAATGVLLTYERQMVSAAQNAAVHREAGASPLGVDALADAAARAGAVPGHVLTLPRDRSHAVKLSKGRRDTVILDPYTGDVLPDAGARTEAFLARVEAIHRWFAFTGKRNEFGEFLKRSANLAFAFILLTGAVLWWPRRWKWPIVRTQLFFRKGLPNAQARHYNWHHVLAAWAFLPLLAISLTGIVFSHDWANRLVFAAFGETPPVRSGPPAQAAADAPPAAAGPAFEPVPLDTLVAQATDGFPGWRRLEIVLPADGAPEVVMTVDSGNGTQAWKKRTVTLARDGSGLAGPPVADAATPGAKARRFIRFLHTGEVFGLAGQTVAGLAALAAVVLVYTGLSLAIRRLIRMRRRARS